MGGTYWRGGLIRAFTDILHSGTFNSKVRSIEVENRSTHSTNTECQSKVSMV